jgi:hypothetical protein
MRRVASVSGPHADRGRVPSQDPRAPRHLEVRGTRASSPFAPYARAPRTGPHLYTRRPRPPPYHGGISAITTTSPARRPYLKAACPPPPSRPPPLLPPLHCASHGRRLASHRPARPLGHRVREHLPRDPPHRPRVTHCPSLRPSHRNRSPPRPPPPATAARPRRLPLRPNFGHHRALGEHMVDAHGHLPGRMRRRTRRNPMSRAAQLV